MHQPRRLLYTLVLLGLLYLLVQVLRTQLGQSMVDVVQRGERLRQMAMMMDHSWGDTWRQLAAGGQACRHPPLAVDDPDISRLLKDVPPLQCAPVDDWVQVDGGTLRIGERARALHGDIECAFTDVLRGSDSNTHDGLTTHSHTEYHLEDSDFVKVRCRSSRGDVWEGLKAGVRHDQDVLDRTGWERIPPQGLGLDVLVFGFDSLSRNMFVRKLPRTHAYMVGVMGAITLTGYNIVGDGTPQALIPLLTGRTELELPETRKRMGSKASYVNVYPFVWNDYRDNGYVTAYLEDCPHIGTFTFRLKGFDSPPTDHYMRPFYVEASKVLSQHPKLCLGSIPRHKVLMDYITALYTVYAHKPKFTFAFHGELTHDSYNMVSAADLDMLHWLQDMRARGMLNNTLLIVMSDHGHRFADIRNTQQGKQEERLPMFSLLFPSWFARAHPDVLEVLRKNSQRLTTPFDIHPTLLGVLRFPGVAKGDVRNRSISLFSEIPLERTCADAFIEPHWCACLDWEVVSVTSGVVLRASAALVHYINRLTRGHRRWCRELRLHQVQWAARLVPNPGLLRFRKNADVDGFVADLSGRTMVSHEVYQVRVRTLPGDGAFEASLGYHVREDRFSVRESDISRTTAYQPYSHCVEQTAEQLRKYCHCTTVREEGGGV